MIITTQVLTAFLENYIPANTQITFWPPWCTARFDLTRPRQRAVWRPYVTWRSTWRGHPDILPPSHINFTNKVLELVSKLVVHSSIKSLIASPSQLEPNSLNIHTPLYKIPISLWNYFRLLKNLFQNQGRRVMGKCMLPLQYTLILLHRLSI